MMRISLRLPVLFLLLVVTGTMNSPAYSYARESGTQCDAESGRCWRVACESEGGACRTYRLSRIRKLCDREGSDCRPMNWSCNIHGQDCAWKPVKGMKRISIPDDSPFPNFNWNF